PREVPCRSRSGRGEAAPLQPRERALRTRLRRLPGRPRDSRRRLAGGREASDLPLVRPGGCPRARASTSRRRRTRVTRRAPRGAAYGAEIVLERLGREQLPRLVALAKVEGLGIGADHPLR